MVTQDVKYHKKCLSVLHNRVRTAESEGPKYKAKEREVSCIVYAILYIEEARLYEETAQVFKLANLVELYQSRMQQNGRDVLLVFEEEIGAVLTKACELDSDNDVVHLALAAQTVRRHMFEEGEPFNGFPEGYQEDSVSSLLLALVSMVLEGPALRIIWQTQPLPHLPLPRC